MTEQTNDVIKEARELWQKTMPWPALCAPQILQEVIIPFYSETHRTYHNLEHVVDCIKLLDLYNDLSVADKMVLATAIWFHDVIYIPEGTANESNSAAIAEIAILASTVVSLSPSFCKISGDINTIKRLILATKHDVEQKDKLCQIVCDIDLAILGGTELEFRKYDIGIRHEYKNVPWNVYLAARGEVLSGFANRQSIYYTDEMRSREEQARHNIKNWAPTYDPAIDDSEFGRSGCSTLLD